MFISFDISLLLINIICFSILSLSYLPLSAISTARYLNVVTCCNLKVVTCYMLTSAIFIFILTCYPPPTITMVFFVKYNFIFLQYTIPYSQFICKTFSLSIRITMSSVNAPSGIPILFRFLYPTCKFLHVLIIFLIISSTYTA